MVLESINRCLRTLEFRHVACHVGELTEAGAFVYSKGRANGEWKFLREKFKKNLIIGSVFECTSAKL